MRLKHDLMVESGGELIIDSGSWLVLGPDVSIESRGRVIARGTAEQPIVIEGADPTQPWGTFALQGAGASGSVFEHVIFRGGGGALLGRVEYKGMVSVHHATEVTFESCRFEDNQRCDDLLNAVHSGVDVRNCELMGARGDAIDFDLSSGEIEGCTIIDPGNDGIDLMSCSPRILSTVIEGAGDKGISIGEASDPLIFDTLIRGCERGIEIKDLSEPLVLDSRIEGCRVGVLQDRKNWRFSGSGRGHFVGTRVSGNERDYKASGGATRTVLNSLFGGDRIAASPPWIRASQGFGQPSVGALPPRSWERVPVSEVVHEIVFARDLHDPSDGWIASDGFERVDAYDDNLIGELREGPGQLERHIDWNLGDDAFEYRLVVEAAGEDIAEAAFELSMVNGTLEYPLVIDPDEHTFRYTTRILAGGRYTGIIMTASPELKQDGTPRKAQLRLRRISVLRRLKEAR